MKHCLVFIVIICVFLSSCTSVRPEKKPDPDLLSSIPSQSLKLINHKNIDFFPDSITSSTTGTFKQVLRIGDGTFNLVNYEESYPLNRKRNRIKIVKHNKNIPFTTKDYVFDVYYKINILEEFNIERYNVPQYTFPLAFFDVDYEYIHDLASKKTYFLHYLLTNTDQTELWLTNSSLNLTHKIDTIDHFEAHPRPMAYYNNYIDYYNGWIAYAKGNDIHLVNLFAELSLIEDEFKNEHIHEILKSDNHNFELDLNLYKQNQHHRIIPDALNAIFIPETPLDMKRLFHLHELENHLLLTLPTQHNTDMMYIFEKQFINPPEVIEFEKDHYRIYHGNHAKNDNPMIIMFDGCADEIKLFDIITQQHFTIDLKNYLTSVDRNIQNLYLTKTNEQYDLIIFPEAFANVQSHYFLVLGLDEKMIPIHQIKVNIEAEHIHHYYQAIYRTQENDFILLAADQDHDHFYLIQFSLDKLTNQIDSTFFIFPYVKGTPMMLYHPGGFFILQTTLLNKYFDHKIRNNTVDVYFFDLQVINVIADDDEEDVSVIAQEE